MGIVHENEVMGHNYSALDRTRIRKACEWMVFLLLVPKSYFTFSSLNPKPIL